MNFYDEQLRLLQEQCARKKRLEGKQIELHSQRSTLKRQVDELKEIMAAEQEDVDRLEGRSLAAFFYRVVGTMDEKLTTERQEAYAAKVKYDAAVRELAGVEEDIKRCEAELAGLEGCESRYESVLKEKAQAVKQQGGAPAQEILQLEERIAYLESQKNELQEAAFAGNAARLTTDQILSSLDSAEGWGTWDLFGGGIVADLAKHSHLDEAQEAVEYLQSQLRTFKTELADVTICAELQVSVDGFLRFADYMFDGIFTDWVVLDQIHHSQQQVEETRSQICNVLGYVNAMIADVEEQIKENKNKIESLVHSVQM